MRALMLVALVVAGSAVYARSFGVPFVFDDRAAIVINLRIRELWPGPFLSARPFVDLTLALNYALGRLDVAGYHLLNLALHVGCGLLLFDLARRTLLLTRTAPGREETVAWWAALLFLVHPLQTEAVTYVISRSELLMGLCYLAMLDLVLLGEMRPRSRAIFWGAAVVVCALGMASKPVMVTAPLAAIWLGRTVLEARGRGPDASGSAGPGIGRWALYVVLAATWAVLAYLIRTYPDPAAGADAGIVPLDYLRTQLGVTWHYFRLLLWPTGQTIDYNWPIATRWLAPEVLAPAAGWLMIIGGLSWLWWSGRAAAAFWLGFALFALAPSSTIVPIADLVFEHRMYLTVGGFAVLVALAFVGAARRFPRLAGAFATMVVIALASATVARNEIWRDPAALWEDALAKAPGKPRIFRQLIATYEQRGDRASAARIAAAEIAGLERERARRPHDVEALGALADAYARSGHQEEAFVLAAETIRRAREDPVARTVYGSQLLRRGRAEEAVAQLEIAEALASRRHDRVAREIERSIWTNLGWAYASVGREVDAVRKLRQAAADDDVNALNNLGSILGRLGEWETAQRVLERAHDREPEDPNVASNLGWVYANLGRLREAAALLENAILRQPREPSAHGNLGWVRLRTGDPAGALHALAAAQALQPDNAWVSHMQGIAHARMGEWSPALKAFARAEKLDHESTLLRENRERAERHEQPMLPGE